MLNYTDGSSPPIYDVAIIGAGVSGAAIARILSQYQLSICLLEKETDISFGVSKANSGIIHAGFHHPLDSLKARLELKGNLMYDHLQHELGFPFRRCGILVAAFSPEEMHTAEHLYNRGRKNGVPGIEICSRERILEMEPCLSHDVTGGLHAPTGGIIEPYRFVFTLVEEARHNGVELLTSFSVRRAVISGEDYRVIAADGRQVRARYVVNAAGLYADEVSRIFSAERFTITPRKGEEYLLERHAAGLPRHVIFPVPTPNSKGTLVIPTVEDTLMIGPTAEEVSRKDDLSTTAENRDKIFHLANRLVPAISRRQAITSFAGLRPTLPGNDFYIAISGLAPRFIQVAGIQSPGLTAAPALAEYVKDLLKTAGLTLTEKTAINRPLSPGPKMRQLTPEEADQHMKKDPAYANMVCRCESISEGEIIEAVRRGHTTLDGVKFYTRAGMGRCQGGFCTYKILKIISRETGRPLHRITKRGGGSTVTGPPLSPQPFAAAQRDEPS